jgi:pimeloyl-ACP methyl ester carboxylesterase
MNVLSRMVLLFFLLSTGLLAGEGRIEKGATTSEDGLEIAYKVRGSGKTTLVFVHCWACEQEYWHKQVDEFAESFQIVTLDVGGHGDSGIDRDHWRIADLAKDVVAVVDALNLQQVILIGHSMGGPVALGAARLLSGRVLGVVCVDTVHNAEMEMPKEMIEQITTAFDADFTGTMNQMVSMLIHQETEPAVTEWILARAAKTYQPAAIGLMHDFINVDLAALLKGAGVPVRAINSAPIPQVIPKTEIEINQKYADYDAVILEGVGHYPQLENPTAFNAMLRKTLQALESSETSQSK